MAASTPRSTGARSRGGMTIASGRSGPTSGRVPLADEVARRAPGRGAHRERSEEPHGEIVAVWSRQVHARNLAATPAGARGRRMRSSARDAQPEREAAVQVVVGPIRLAARAPPGRGAATRRPLARARAGARLPARRALPHPPRGPHLPGPPRRSARRHPRRAPAGAPSRRARTRPPPASPSSARGAPPPRVARRQRA